MKRILAAAGLLVLPVIAYGAAWAAVPGDVIVNCATQTDVKTASVPPITYSDGGSRSGTIPGASATATAVATACATVTTPTGTTPATTTVPTTTTAPTTTTTPPPPAGPCGTNSGTPAINKVVWIWMENHDYSQIVGSSATPYENQLASQCGLATNYAGVSHPSLPNYIAATSGSTQGITDDAAPSSHVLNVPSIFGQVASKSYQESMPSNCLLSDSGNYAVKHNPEAYYTPVRTACNAGDVPMGTTSSGAFLSDLNAGSLPAFSFVTPNLCNDMHDCSVATGDAWLQSWVPKLFASPDYTSGHLAIFVVFDENDGSTGNHVYAAVASPYTAVGARSATSFSHYSLLRTTEEILGQPLLGSAASANSMAASFNLGAPTPPPPPPTSCTKTLAAGGNIYSFASALVPGDTGCVNPGIYGSRNGSNHITLNGTAAAPITLESTPGGTGTQINGDNQLAGQYGTFSGLKFDVATDDTGSTCQTGVARAQTFFVSGSNLQVTHNEFTTSDPAHSSNGMYVTGSNDRIDHNKIHGTGSCHAHDHGIYVGSGTGTIIDHNWITDETFGWCIQLYPSPAGGTTQPNIYSNVCDHNESGLILCTSGSHWHFVNNVVSNSTGNFQAAGSLVDGCGPSGSDYVVQSNDAFNDPGGFGNYSAGNISVDPQYANAAAHDYRVLNPSLAGYGLWDGR